MGGSALLSSKIFPVAPRCKIQTYRHEEEEEEEETGAVQQVEDIDTCFIGQRDGVLLPVFSNIDGGDGHLDDQWELL